MSSERLAPSPILSTDWDCLPIGLAVVDEELRVRYWNSTLERWTELPREVLLGKPLPEVHPAWEVDEFRGRLVRVLAGTGPVVFPPLEGPHHGSSVSRVFHVRASSLDHAPERWALVSFEDVTPLSHRLHELQNQEEQHQRKMREIHHRVKNNLNILSGLVSLQRSRAEGSVVSTLDDLQSRITALSEIHDLLYLPTGPSSGPVAWYLASLAQLLNQNLSVSSHHLVLDLDPEVVLDTERTAILGMIVAELMTNALKYGLRGRTEEQIALGLRRDGPSCVLELSHSGDHLPPNFDPQTSTGLGMVLLTAYAEQLGTFLEWSRGPLTRFWLRFPL